MATTQINARIDSRVKSAGDFGLTQVNPTPTQAVRALWSYLGQNAHDKTALEQLFELIEGESAEQQAQGAARRAALAHEGPRIFGAALAEMGVGLEALPKLSDDDLLEQAFLEKARERGTDAGACA